MNTIRLLLSCLSHFRTSTRKREEKRGKEGKSSIDKEFDRALKIKLVSDQEVVFVV